MPALGKTAPRAILGHAEIGQRRVVQHQVHLGLQALAALFPVGIGLHIAEIDLVDDGQHRDLEQDGVQPGAFHGNGDLARLLALADGNAALRQMEQAQEIDKIALDEAQAAKIIQLFVGETQLAQLMHLLADFVQVGAQIDPRRAALIAIFDLGGREMVQHHLHHGKLVQVGIEQRSDNHDAWGSICGNHSISGVSPVPDTLPASRVIVPRGPARVKSD